MTKLLCVLAVSVLCGCASTPAELKSNPAGIDTFITNQSGLSIYRKILTNSQNKYESGIAHIQANFWDDTKSGDVSYMVGDAMGMTKNTYFTIEINQLDNSRTKVTTYYLLGTWKRIAKEVRTWCNAEN